jgi:hypothetical protein
MESGPMINKLKTELKVNLILGLVLLIAGIFVELYDVQILDNNRFIVALSFIPLGLFVASLIKIYYVKKNPNKYVDEYDERLIAAREKADALSMRIIRYLLFLAFLGYSFAKSSEVFESLSWWLLLIISLITVFLPLIIYGDANKKYKPDSVK